MAVIVQCANFVTPRSGGLRTAMRHLAEGYAGLGHRVVQIVPGHRDEIEHTYWGTVHHLRAPVLPGSGGYRVLTRPSRVTDLLAELAPDRLEVHDRLTLRGLGHWAQRQRLRALVVVHERLDLLAARLIPGGPRLRRMVDANNRGLAAGFDTVVCTTDWAAQEFDRLPVANLRRVALGVDLAGFHPANHDSDLRRRLAPDGAVLLVAAVRLSPEKAPMRVVETVRELLDRGLPVRCAIAGDGPLRQRMERAAAGLPIEFLGFLSDRADLARLLASADVVVAPGPIETFGLAALEALASGTPVVVDAASALPEVIGSAGWAVPGRPTAFADAVQAVLDRPRRPVRLAARDRAERFDWSRTVAGFLRAHRLEPTAAVP
jgi:alpha-1,6-mannosyltransferase